MKMILDDLGFVYIAIGAWNDTLQIVVLDRSWHLVYLYGSICKEGCKAIQSQPCSWIF